MPPSHETLPVHSMLVWKTVTLLLLRNDLLLSFLGDFACLFDFGRGGDEGGGGWLEIHCALNASERLSNSARRACSTLSYFRSWLGGSSYPRGSSASSNCCVWRCLRFFTPREAGHTAPGCSEELRSCRHISCVALWLTKGSISGCVKANRVFSSVTHPFSKIKISVICRRRHPFDVLKNQCHCRALPPTRGFCGGCTDEARVCCEFGRPLQRAYKGSKPFEKPLV